MSSVGAAEVIEIDIRTRVIRNDEKFHILFPGEAHSLYSAILEREAVFLDLPGFDLGGSEAFEDLVQIKERIAYSDAIKAWLREGAEPTSAPDRNLGAYSDLRGSQRKSLLAGAIQRLYFDMKPGDIVIVPGTGYQTDVLIGEIVGQTSPMLVPEVYGEVTVPARRVRWLARKQKRFLSSELIARLGTPNFLVQLDKSLRSEVLNIAFDNFVIDGTYVSKFSTSEHSFNTLDEFQIQAFVNFVAGALVAADGGGAEANSFDLDDAITLLTDRPDLAPSLAITINSPGFLTVFDENIRPIALGVFLAAALSTPGAAADLSKVKIVNSSAPAADQCVVQVDAAVKEAFTLMNYDAWQKACYRAQQAKSRTGLDASAKLIVAPKASTKPPADR